GALYLIPIQRHLPIFPGFGGYFFTNTAIWNREIGENYVPRDADDLKRILVQLTNPQGAAGGSAMPASATPPARAAPSVCRPTRRCSARLTTGVSTAPASSCATAKLSHTRPRSAS